jgi:hypothetical protein
MPSVLVMCIITDVVVVLLNLQGGLNIALATVVCVLCNFNGIAGSVLWTPLAPTAVPHSQGVMTGLLLASITASNCCSALHNTCCQLSQQSEHCRLSAQCYCCCSCTGALAGQCAGSGARSSLADFAHGLLPQPVCVWLMSMHNGWTG